MRCGGGRLLVQIRPGVLHRPSFAGSLNLARDVIALSLDLAGVSFWAME